MLIYKYRCFSQSLLCELFQGLPSPTSFGFKWRISLKCTMCNRNSLRFVRQGLSLNTCNFRKMCKWIFMLKYLTMFSSWHYNVQPKNFQKHTILYFPPLNFFICIIWFIELLITNVIWHKFGLQNPPHVLYNSRKKN